MINSSTVQIFWWLRNSLVVMIGTFVFVSCQWSQDPMENKPDFIKKASPSKKTVIPRPINSDAIRLHGPSVVTASENEEIEIEFEPKLLVDHYVIDGFEVLNSDFFSEIQVDSKKFSVRWKPSKKDLEYDVYVTKELKVRVWAKPQVQMDLPVIQSERTVAILVKRKAQIPTVEEISVDVSHFREGSTYLMTILVRDVNGGEKKGVEPAVELLPPKATDRKRLVNLAAMIHLVSKVKEDPQGDIWKFRYQVSLPDVNLTDSSVLGGMEVAVRSGFGVSSEPVSFRIPIYTRLSDLVVLGMPQKLKVAAGSSLNFEFLVVDPMGEGQIRVDSELSKIPLGAELNCKNEEITTLLQCEFVWITGMEMAGRWYLLSLHAVNSNREINDPLVKKHWFKTWIYVGLESDRPSWPENPPSGQE
ncbi:MAG: hypothetical protein NZ480_08855 [Bdellovibrionaceae bacterium]|nr:hypothetical protein [Pseudobdellovibrionaceae bacterium]MDW8189420.1 hypothetical protein [Pseudobdellovibrionaceae bacterium]